MKSTHTPLKTCHCIFIMGNKSFHTRGNTHRNRKYTTIDTSREVSLHMGRIHTHTQSLNRQTETGGKRNEMTAQSEWRRKEITCGFHCCSPLSFLTHDKWFVIGHKITHADFSSQSQETCSFLPFLSLYFSHFYVCVHPSLALFLFLSPPLSSLVFRHLPGPH